MTHSGHNTLNCLRIGGMYGVIHNTNGEGIIVTGL